MNIISILGVALGSAWTSGINLYATVFVLGLLQHFTSVKLPGGLHVFDNWIIIGVAGVLYLVEFVADKVPYIDSVWDVIHTFIRVPAGAIIALAATTDLDPTIQIIALLIGGGLSLSSHGTKATLRAAANLSPEPISNWTLSIIEDIIAVAGVIIAVVSPILIIIIIAIFLVVFFWIAKKVITKIIQMMRSVKNFFFGKPATVSE
jgi:hypothetical protein